MVKALHRAGIEVILDVVYNHTAEGNEQGSMLSFKGIDNATYYRPSPENRRYYMDFTGTGNTLDPTHPSVLRLIMDSLRYFATECHVDGFRFDLAPTLARTFYEVDRLSSFLDAIHQDPVLSRLKLTAELWDVGPGGYQVGNFPELWREWNADYRDTVRDFWRGEASLAAFAERFTGSQDLYGDDGRRPLTSINFVTAHDGFTLNDLVSYNEKHNEANLEDNRDGNDQNRSWNCGAEGPTDDPEILGRIRGVRSRDGGPASAAIIMVLCARRTAQRSASSDWGAWGCRPARDWSATATRSARLTYGSAFRMSSRRREPGGSRPRRPSPRTLMW